MANMNVNKVIYGGEEWCKDHGYLYIRQRYFRRYCGCR